MRMQINGKFLRSKVSRRIAALFFIAAVLPATLLASLTYYNTTQAIQKQHHAELVEASRTYGLAVLGRLLFARSVIESAVKDDTTSSAFMATLSSMFDHVSWLAASSLSDTQPPLQIEAATSARLPVHIFLSAIAKNGRVLRADLHHDYLWGERGDINSAYNICVYAATQRIFCTYPDEIEQGQKGPSQAGMINSGSWELFLKPTFQTDSWKIVTTRRFVPAEAAPGSFLSTYLAVAALSVLLTLLLSLILIRRTMVPLEKLMDGTRRIAHGDYQKIEVFSNDEFGDLTQAVNNMSGQIRQQLDTLQTLSAIDHEMRNRIDLKYMIKMVGSAMRRLLPSSTLYVARYRNDEFATDCLFIDHENATLIEQEVVISEDEIARLEQHYEGQLAVNFSFFPRLESHQQNWSIALIWQGRRCGALSLVWSTSKSMDAATRSTLIELANRVAIAIQIQEREQRLLYQALFDNLTGLLNRHGLEQKIVKIMQQSAPAAILFVDVDRFKLVNDSFGHKTGDQLLQAIAARIMTCHPQCIGGRLGGDEFVLLLETNSNEEVTTIVRKLMALLVQPFTIESQQLSITSSVGIALHPAHIRDGLTMIERADIAMYQAKQSGRNSYRFYSEHMSAETHHKLALEESLRVALVENEFILHYQPKVDLATRKIVGAEALVRWNHPEKGLVFPSYFIRLAEETSLIVSLGSWVMREACRQNMLWRRDGYSAMRIAVNVSARQFNEPGFVETVEKILQETGLPADGLEIEVTESMLMGDLEQSISILNALSQLGVSLSIDDFGTGYSSLAYLKRFPINVLKIDQSFVRDLVDDNDDRLIIASIIALAHNLQLRVVAEGVETHAQVDYLQKQLCDEIQGYYFSRPVPSRQFTSMLQEEKMLSMPER